MRRKNRFNQILEMPRELDSKEPKITIVLNCSYLAMVVRQRLGKKNRVIAKVRNLLYNRFCN